MHIPLTRTRRRAAVVAFLTVAVAAATSCAGGPDQPEWAVTSATTAAPSSSELVGDDGSTAQSVATTSPDTAPTTAPGTSSTITIAPVPPTTVAAGTNLTAPRPAAPVVLPAEPGLAPVVSRVPTTDRVIFLTIDDGIWRVPGVAEKLRELGIPFTSFLTQPFAREDVNYWRRTLDLGGRIQSHTTNHPDLGRTNPRRTILEVCSTRQPFQELFGQSQDLFRPPYGRVTEMVRRAAAGCGFRAV
ncbi:MAG: polysaccharide deacetylase family protein, partial [Actinomycetes bacterium]